MPYTQENRLMAIATPLGGDTVILTGFSGEEGISRLFRFDLELLSTNDSISFDSIVGGNVTVRLTMADGGSLSATSISKSKAICSISATRPGFLPI